MYRLVWIKAGVQKNCGHLVVNLGHWGREFEIGNWARLCYRELFYDLNHLWDEEL